MKEAASGSVWRNIGNWFITVTPVVVYLVLYVSSLILAASDGLRANYALFGLGLLGTAVLWLVLIRICNVHHLTTWRSLKEYPFWMTVVLMGVALWHAGAAFVGFADIQTFFVYAPPTTLLLVLSILFVRFLMEEAKTKYDV